MDVEEPYEGQKFTSFDVLKKYLEEYGHKKFVKFWIRSSHTISSLKSKTSKRYNPDLKYASMKFACIFGGEKIRCRASGIRKSSTYRNLGCPCMINAIVGEDGNHVKLESVHLEHNHALCKSLYDSLKKTRSKIKLCESGIKMNQNSLLKKDTVIENQKPNEDAVKNETRDEKFMHSGDLGCNIQQKDENICEKNSDLMEKDAHIASSESFQGYIKTMQEKYGNNLKIIVVDREQSENNDMRENSNIVKKKATTEFQYHETDEELDEFKHSEGYIDKDMCRLCLSTSNKLNPIFKPSLPLESTILSFKIMSCASIEVRNDDELPSNICTTCEEILEIAYNFRMRCENSDSLLRKAYLSNRFIDSSNISDNLIYSEKKAVELKLEEACVATNEDSISYHDSVKVEKETFLEFNGDVDIDSCNEICTKFNEICPICNSVFDTYLDMLHHLKEHTDIENFLLTCNLCGVVHTSVKMLLKHMDEHLMDVKGDWKGETLKCTQCEMSFLTPEDARAHTETHMTAESLKGCEVSSVKPITTASGYLCNICGKILRSKDRFQSHRNTHEGLRPHICLKCGRGFADRKNMHQHYDIVHLRKANHECPICHKKFYAPTKMKSHITMHYGVKPFSCEICNKTFRLRMNMIKHKKTHSNERPHKCDKCNAAFIDKNLLKRHSYVHGGERPHVCPYCGHRFTVKFNLKKHMISGKCCGKNKVKGEFPVDIWSDITETNSQTNLNEDECAVKCETDQSVEFNQQNESIQIDVLPEYEEK